MTYFMEPGIDIGCNKCLFYVANIVPLFNVAYLLCSTYQFREDVFQLWKDSMKKVSPGEQIKSQAPSSLA